MYNLWKSQWPKLIFYALFACLCVSLGILAELKKADLVNAAISGGLGKDYGIVGLFLLILLLYLLLYSLFLLSSRFFINRLTDALRRRLFQALLRLDGDSRKAYSEGEIMAKYSTQLNEIKDKLLRSAAQLLIMLLQCLFVCVTFFKIHCSLALAAIAIYSVLLFIPKIFEARVGRCASSRVKQFEKHLEDFNAYISNMELIKNAQIEVSIRRRFERSLEQFFAFDLSLWRARADSFGIAYLAMLFSRALVILYAALLVRRGELSAGLFFSVLALAENLQAPLFWLSKLYQDIISARPALQSVQDFLHEGDQALPAAEPSLPAAASLEFAAVSFAYPQLPILENVSFTLEAGGKYLLTGRSGAGKSTVIKLIQKRLEPDRGEIKIAGKTAEHAARAADYIAYVRQEPKLFSLSLKDNIALFEPLSDAETACLLKKVGLEDLLPKLESVKVNELSGGEKKRLALLRALRQRKPLLLLDEPLANIDPKNVAQIEDLILDIPEATVLVISHQFSREKLGRFTKVFRLEGGQIAEEAFL